MHHFFVNPEQVEDGLIRITGSDVNHIKNVLRIRQGGGNAGQRRHRQGLPV